MSVHRPTTQEAPASGQASAESVAPKRKRSYGAWEVTQAELQIALSLSEGDDPLADAAYQLVRYCHGHIFYRDQAEAALQQIRKQETG